MRGDKRVARFQHARASSFEVGWGQRVFPADANRAGQFLVTPAGALLTVPVGRRERGEGRGFRDNDALPLAATEVAAIVGALGQHTDPGNVPLSEERENWLAWLGVELQALNRELARAHNVSDQTDEGRSGALVTHVYPDSPAAAAGIVAGNVLLRVHLPGKAQPVEVRLEEQWQHQEAFPWHKLDEVPEQYYERIPQPWPPVENTLLRLLTDLGVGAKYGADFAQDGKVARKEFTVVEGPACYESAKRYQADALGLTVRDLTFDVRRYLQKKPDEPGVVVSRVAPGSKASVAGIKPFELITHVNDQPVLSVADFEKQLQAGGDLRLSVRRMAKSRLVNLQQSAPAK